MKVQEGILERQDAAMRQRAVLNLLACQQLAFLPHRSDYLHKIHVKFGNADGHISPLGCAKFHRNRCRVVDIRLQQYQKFPLLVNGLSAWANPLTDI